VTNSASTRARSRRRGFTLIEILVALLIVAGGLLGNIALHAHAVRHNSHGLLHLRAVRLGGDVAAALRLFPEAVGHYGASAMPQACITTAQICTAEDWARLMLDHWKRPGADALPGAALSITGSASGTAVIEIGWTAAANERRRWRQTVTLRPGP
jgi:prepilin-type N-terminal cleavage/methylation domain-containing protein